MNDVSRLLKRSKDVIELISGGMMFQSCGPLTAKELSYAVLAERGAEFGRYGILHLIPCRG